MQTTIHINLCGRIIQITDDAWKKHLAYIDTLHNYFIIIVSFRSNKNAFLLFIMLQYYLTLKKLNEDLKKCPIKMNIAAIYMN